MRGLRTIKRHAIEFGENEEEIVERGRKCEKERWRGGVVGEECFPAL